MSMTGMTFNTTTRLQPKFSGYEVSTNRQLAQMVGKTVLMGVAHHHPDGLVNVSAFPVKIDAVEGRQGHVAQNEFVAPRKAVEDVLSLNRTKGAPELGAVQHDEVDWVQFTPVNGAGEALGPAQSMFYGTFQFSPQVGVMRNMVANRVIANGDYGQSGGLVSPKGQTDVELFPTPEAAVAWASWLQRDLVSLSESADQEETQLRKLRAGKKAEWVKDVHHEPPVVPFPSKIIGLAWDPVIQWFSQLNQCLQETLDHARQVHQELQDALAAQPKPRRRKSLPRLFAHG